MQLIPADGAKPNLGRTAHRGRGFSLIEFMVTISLAALLLGLAAPSFVSWIRNSQVRTVTDSLQNGLRLAQTEAVRRQRQVVFFLTTSAACDTGNTATASGPFWVIRTVPLLGDEGAQVVQCGVLADVASGTTINGPTALCFNAAGRVVANPTPGGGTGCAAGATQYNVQRPGADRTLRVLVSLGGQMRLCDPDRPSTQPDGCPA